MLYLLYTSGTTAKPKGILHTTAGYLLGTSFSHEAIFDVKPDDVYWCAADIGWVTGHSYIVYGPLANATTGVMWTSWPRRLTTIAALIVGVEARASSAWCLSPTSLPRR